MKLMKTKLTLLLAVMYLTGLSQVEFAPIGAEWYYNFREEMQSPATGYYTLKSVKDTIIGSKECKVLLRTLVSSKGIASNDGQSIIYHNTNENKIYRYLYGNFYLLYDFNKVKGDTIIIKEPNSASSYDSIVAVIDSVGIETLPNNIQLKSFYFGRVEGGKFAFFGKIIEKIGNLGFFFPINSLDCDGGCPEPLRCYNDNQINFVSNERYVSQVPCDFVYTQAGLLNTNEISVFPNPFANSFTIKSGDYGKGMLSIDIMNLYGQSIVHDVLPENMNHKVDLHGYPSGFYYLVIKNREKATTYKLIKNNYLP
jgi:hypothetical protein